MEILYYRDPSGNFGDDLNAVLWRRLLPEDVLESPGAVLMGIGSIFNAATAPSSKTSGKRMFVIGSGAGYGPLPPGWQDWNILAVRGPLTAELIGRPDVAATDAAALLSLCPDLMSLNPQRDKILFMPHHHTADKGQWAKVAAELGFLYVDPRWPMAEVMKAFASAALVITEAMHGAIVADTMRIPWIPILIAPDALPFKWRDWTLSLDLQYQATRIPPSSVREIVSHRSLERRAKASKTVPSVLTKDMDSKDSLIADFRERYRSWAPSSQTRSARGPRATAIRKAVHSASALLDDFFIERAIGALKKLDLDKHYLSRQSVLDAKVEQLTKASASLVDALRA